MKDLLRALRVFRADRPRLLLVFGLMLLSILTNLVKPWPLALIVDSVLGDKPLPRPLWVWFGAWSKLSLLGLLSASILFLHSVQGIFSAAYHILSIQIGLRGLTIVRNQVFARLQRLSLRTYHSSNSGDLIYRASWDTYAFQTLFQQGLVTCATATLSLALMVAIMCQLNLLLTWIALATVPGLILAIRILGKRMTGLSLAAQKADSKITSLVQQSIRALPLTQSYTSEALEVGRFERSAIEARQRRLSQHGWELLYWLVITLIFGLGTWAITYMGAKQVWMGSLTVGELLVFLAYLGQLYDPLNQLAQAGSSVSSATAGTKRVFEILDLPEEVKERPDARPVAQPADRTAGHVAAARPAEKQDPGSAPKPLLVRGTIELEHVFFSYASDQFVLRDLSFSVAAGQSMAIIGPSGSGKTTLLYLLPRFFDPTSGCVRLDGVDLRDLRLKDLRSQISLVMQEPILLTGSVAENIAYGRPEAPLDEIQAAARAANADRFILRLPHGYDTQLGEGAAQLSAGEKQRINLARAFLKDSPILVLDEPTSALDVESETLVFASLRLLMRGRTTLMVAHRLTTIGSVDSILSLEQGQISEIGSPAALKSGRGYYARVLAGHESLA